MPKTYPEKEDIIIFVPIEYRKKYNEKFTAFDMGPVNKYLRISKYMFFNIHELNYANKLFRKKIK